MCLYPGEKYTQAHSSVQKAANIAGLGDNLRLIPTTAPPTPDSPTSKSSIGAAIKDKLGWAWRRGQNQGCPYGLDAEDLAEAMQLDRRKGFTPVFVSANVGSTNSCAVDPVRAIADVCRRGYGPVWCFVAFVFVCV